MIAGLARGLDEIEMHTPDVDVRIPRTRGEGHLERGAGVLRLAVVLIGFGIEPRRTHQKPRKRLQVVHLTKSSMHQHRAKIGPVVTLCPDKAKTVQKIAE